MPEAVAPDLVIVGHVTQDVVDGRLIPGGTVTYAGRMAHALGARVGVVTSAAPSFDFEAVLPGIQVHSVPADATSTFENVYSSGTRRQYIRAVATPLTAEDVPEEWRGAATALLAPLTNEVAAGVERRFDGRRAATPQGWLRRWGSDGLVRHEGWQALIPRLAELDAVILSEHDVNQDEATIDALRQSVRTLVVTRGDRGGRLYVDGRGRDYPAFRASEVDPTGAGDVFAGAFLVELDRAGDPEKACLLASCAASFSVEAPGADGIPTPEQIERRLHG